MFTHSLAGLLMQLTAAEVINSPLNRSVVFVKTADVIQTSDFWKVVHLNLTPYEEAITTLREDIIVVQLATRHPARLDEIHRVQIPLETLEGKLENLKGFLPKAERRRGFFDIGGAALRVLFGVATVADLSGLHDTVNTLSQRQSAISHAINDRVTYLKQLNGAVKLDQEAIANLSAIVKGYSVKSREEIQKTVTRFEWVKE
jgi:hypothetical protein